MDTYVKENYNLSCAQVCSDPNVSLQPELVFKDKGKCSVPYRIYQTESTFMHIYQTESNYAVYVLNDYIAHIMPESKEALIKRGYILVIIGSRVTADIQVNDIDLHAPLKDKYQEQEQSLMIELNRRKYCSLQRMIWCEHL